MIPWAGLEKRFRESGRRNYELRRPVRGLVQPGNDKGYNKTMAVERDSKTKK